MYVWTNMAPQTMVHGLSRGGSRSCTLGPFTYLLGLLPRFQQNLGLCVSVVFLVGTFSLTFSKLKSVW